MTASAQASRLRITCAALCHSDFCSYIGISKGYFGIQDLGEGHKLVIFSVWDPGEQNNPQHVSDDQQVKLLHKDAAVRTGRFGGEGTGGQSFFDYNWTTGVTYRCMVRAVPNGNRTEFSGFFFIPESNQWKHLVTFSTLAGGTLVTRPYSFVEDFRRNKESTMLTRKALFGNGWMQAATGSWHELDHARFTADSNPAMNIDAGIEQGQFYLMTGGAITNKAIPLWDTFARPQKNAPPKDLLKPSAEQNLRIPSP